VRRKINILIMQDNIDKNNSIFKLEEFLRTGSYREFKPIQ